jgi:hypothetical protein
MFADEAFRANEPATAMLGPGRHPTRSGFTARSLDSHEMAVIQGQKFGRSPADRGADHEGVEEWVALCSGNEGEGAQDQRLV